MRDLAVIVFVAGCYSAHPIDGAACASDNECPAPLACSHGTCTTHAASPDASADASRDAGFACTPIVDATGVLAAPAMTPTIDGDISDWTSCFVDVDATNGVVFDYGAMGRFPSARFSVAHDTSHLYIAAVVDGVLPLGDQPPPAIYQNNSVSVYIDASGSSSTAMYGSDGAQIVVDHANQQQSFRNTNPIDLAGIASAAQTAQATYTIELAIATQTFDVASFGGPSGIVGFDIGFEGGNGSAQTSEVLWTQSCSLPTCGCSDTKAAPYCDARELGEVVLR